MVNVEELVHRGVRNHWFKYLTVSIVSSIVLMKPISQTQVFETIAYSLVGFLLYHHIAVDIIKINERPEYFNVALGNVVRSWIVLISTKLLSGEEDDLSMDNILNNFGNILVGLSVYYLFFFDYIDELKNEKVKGAKNIENKKDYIRLYNSINDITKTLVSSFVVELIGRRKFDSKWLTSSIVSSSAFLLFHHFFYDFE